MLLDRVMLATKKQRMMPKASGYGDGRLAEEIPAR